MSHAYQLLRSANKYDPDQLTDTSRGCCGVDLQVRGMKRIHHVSRVGFEWTTSSPLPADLPCGVMIRVGR